MWLNLTDADRVGCTSGQVNSDGRNRVNSNSSYLAEGVGLGLKRSERPIIFEEILIFTLIEFNYKGFHNGINRHVA